MKIEDIHHEITEDDGAEVDVLIRRASVARRFVGEAVLVVGAVNREQDQRNETKSYTFLLGAEDGARACLATAIVFAMRRGLLALGLWAALRADQTETLRQIGEALRKSHPNEGGPDGRAGEGAEPAAGGEGEPGARGEREGEQPQEDPQEGDERGPGPD